MPICVRMISDRYMPLNKAAAILGVSTKTARKWLEMDCGLSFPRARFQRSLVSERDLAAVIAKRAGRREWSARKVG